MRWDEIRLDQIRWHDMREHHTWNSGQPSAEQHISTQCITLQHAATHCNPTTQSPHGGDQTWNICNSRLETFPVHSCEWRGLPFTPEKIMKFWELPWKLVWKLRGLLWKLVEMLAVIIIQVWSLASVGNTAGCICECHSLDFISY